ncbi:MAG: Mce protein [Mycobacterium sp.]|nr:Mce protein [Mycobacterium sp.]
MADDAAAPEGELTKPTTDPKAEEAESSAVVPESQAVEVTAADDAASVDESGLDDEDIDAEDIDDEDIDDDVVAPARTPMSHVKMALIAGVAVVVALAGLTGWLAYRTYESIQAEAERNLFVQVGRQGALNLTSIDWENAEADVQRILDSATGTFYDDFQQRAQPFVEVVKQAQSKSTGTIAEAGLESMDDNEAQVLVAVTVQTSNAGAPEQEPRAWRMRILVEKVGDEAKVSNVEFVP